MDDDVDSGEFGVMRAEQVDVIGAELAVRWSDGGESYIPLERLRRACPCAGCAGEVDVLGHLHRGPRQELGPSAFRVRRLAPVGGYAIQPHWEDGHGSGLFSWDYLRRIAEDPGQGGG